MSYFDLIPTEILELKHELETKDVESFAYDFDMHIKQCKIVSTSLDNLWDKRIHYRYDSVVHLTYKPTNKSIITPFSFGSKNQDSKPQKLDVVHGICFDAYYFKDGDWAYYKDNDGKLLNDISYAQYCDSGEGSDLTYKQFIRWKVQVRKTDLMLGDAFEKFIQCYDQL